MRNIKASALISLMASIMAFYFLNRYIIAYEMSIGNVIDKLATALDQLVPGIIAHPFMIGLTRNSLIAGIIGVLIIWLIYLYVAVGKKNYMPGIEHGSAKWGDKKNIVNFIDEENPDNNIILTETESLSMSDRMKRTRDDDFNRNKNVLIVGSSGSGKTRYYVKPNIMQMHSSYVISDPKGELIHQCGKMLADSNYVIKVFDLISRENTDGYNPFKYIKTPDDILKLVNNLIMNTSNSENKTDGDFWVKSETALLQAIFAYIFYEMPEEEKTISSALELLRYAEIQTEDKPSQLDGMFKKLSKKTPDHFAVKQYAIFSLGAEKTRKSVLISAGVRLAPFNIPSISNIVSRDTLELDKLGDRKTALFILLPDTDKSFNFLAAMLFQQLFDTLVYHADHDFKNGRLTVPVRCIMEEFANIGQIPDFKILITTIRSRGISVNIVLQNLAQLKSLYRYDWETISGNCDTLLFLGGMEQSTLEYISKMCGQTTIDNRNVNEGKGQASTYSIQYQILGRNLITPDEVGRLKGRECILIISRNRPYRSRKYDVEKHKNYPLLSDANQANWFDTKQYLKQKRII